MAKVMVENEANLTIKQNIPKKVFELAHSKVEKCRYVSYMCQLLILRTFQTYLFPNNELIYE